MSRAVSSPIGATTYSVVCQGSGSGRQHDGRVDNQLIKKTTALVIAPKVNGNLNSRSVSKNLFVKMMAHDDAYQPMTYTSHIWAARLSAM